MIKQYYLNQQQLPKIPLPHDCIIQHIEVKNDFLILEFEEDITIHDGMKDLFPDGNSLVMRIHLLDCDSIRTLKSKRIRNRKTIYVDVPASYLSSYNNKGLTYLYHFVAYSSMILKLYCCGEIIIDIDTDYVEFQQ